MRREMTGPGVATVVAMDTRQVARLEEEKYRKLSDFAVKIKHFE